MVPRRLLLERLLGGFPAEHIRFNRRAVGFVNTSNGVRVDFDDGSSAEGDQITSDQTRPWSPDDDRDFAGNWVDLEMLLNLGAR